MTLHVTEHEMTSPVSPHIARRLESGVWVVSWLPGRELDRNGAAIAIAVAELLAKPNQLPVQSMILADYATELGVSLTEARRLIEQPSSLPTAAELDEIERLGAPAETIPDGGDQ